MTNTERIKAEIERLRKLLKEPDAACFQEAYLIGGEDALNSISSFIESLEKEQPQGTTAFGVVVKDIDNNLRVAARLHPMQKEVKFGDKVICQIWKEGQR